MLKILIAILALTAYCLAQDSGSFLDCSDLVDLRALGLEEFMFPNVGGWAGRPYYFSRPNEDRSIHHVIPARRLREFYNTVIENARYSNEVMPFFGSFLQRIFDSISNRVRTIMPEHLNPRVFLRSFQNYQDPSVRVRMTPFYWGHAIFLNLFNWLPGNLFLGPRPERRTDDPGDSFEVGARNVFESEQFRRLENADRLITRYINQRQADYNPDPAVRLEDIISLLEEIVAHSIIYNFDENDWVRDRQGKYHIRTTTPGNQNRHDELKKRQVENDIVNNSPFKIMADGTCSVTDRATTYSTTDKTACTIAWIALASVPDRVAIDPQYSGTLKSIAFKNTRASSFTAYPGLKQDYYLRGKVEDVFYDAMNGRCYIAVDDDQIIYKNKYHESTDSEICLTAVGALINNDVVVVKAALEKLPKEAHVISKLYIEKLCKKPRLYFMKK